MEISRELLDLIDSIFIKNYMLISGVLGSYLEGYVIEMVTGRPAVSAVSVLEESRERGIDLKTLSSDNISKDICYYQ